MPIVTFYSCIDFPKRDLLIGELLSPHGQFFFQAFYGSSASLYGRAPMPGAGQYQEADLTCFHRAEAVVNFEQDSS